MRREKSLSTIMLIYVCWAVNYIYFQDKDIIMKMKTLKRDCDKWLRVLYML